MKHRECLARQREYFSELAINNADQALARVLNDLEQLCSCDNADQLMASLLRQVQRRHGPLGLVGSQTASLNRSLLQLRHDSRILRAGVDAVAPGPLIRAASRRCRAASCPPRSSQREREPRRCSPRRCPSSSDVRAVITTHSTDMVNRPGVRVFAAGHPSPNADSAAAAEAALELAHESRDRGGLLVLLSGGASAMLVAPAHGITLEEKVATTTRLMHAGAAIHELNCVAKHLSRIKGGSSRPRPAGRSRWRSRMFRLPSPTILR